MFYEKKGLLFVSCGTFVAFLAFLLFDYTSMIDGPILETVFNNRTFLVSVMLSYNQITPILWTFLYWKLVNIYNAFWLIFIIGMLIIYKGCFTFDLWTMITFGVTNILGIVWLVLFSKDEIPAAFAIITLMMVTSIATAVLATYQTEVKIKCSSNSWILTTMRILLTNGLGMYASWVFYLFYYFFNVLLIEQDVNPKTSGIVLSCFYIAFLIGYFLFDMTYLYPYTRYIFTPYITWIWAFSGVITFYNYLKLPIKGAIPILMIVILVILALEFAMKIFFSMKHFYHQKLSGTFGMVCRNFMNSKGCEEAQCENQQEGKQNNSQKEQKEQNVNKSFV